MVVSTQSVSTWRVWPNFTSMSSLGVLAKFFDVMQKAFFKLEFTNIGVLLQAVAYQFRDLRYSVDKFLHLSAVGCRQAQVAAVGGVDDSRLLVKQLVGYFRGLFVEAAPQLGGQLYVSQCLAWLTLYK